MRDGWTDRQTDLSQLIVAFRNSVNAPQHAHDFIWAQSFYCLIREDLKKVCKQCTRKPHLVEIPLFRTFISLMFEGREELQSVRFNPQHNKPIHTALLSRSVSHRRVLFKRCLVQLSESVTRYTRLPQDGNESLSNVLYVQI
jgi:hypothetical protein